MSSVQTVRAAFLYGPGEDHPTGSGLQYFCHFHFDAVTNVPAAVFHHDHRAIVQIPHPLTRLFAFLDDAHLHSFTG